MTSTTNKVYAFRDFQRAEAISETDGRIVASPASTQEIAELLRRANEARLLVQIAGAGTKRGWSNPAQADVIVQTGAIAGVMEHSWQDMTCTVRAGTPWASMQRVLAAHGQHVALDPLWPERATVGGVLATNDSGALRLKFGSPRDLVLGMTIVLVDGTVARSGGKVVKNVAGYDLHKLMIGAFGTLGLISDVTFRLHPLAGKTQTLSFESAEAASASELMMKVLDSHLSVRAMQMRVVQHGFVLDVELTSVPEVVQEHAEILGRMAAGVGLRSTRDEGRSAFNAREELFSREGGAVLKVTMLPSIIGEMSAGVRCCGGLAVTQAVGIMFARFEDEAGVQQFTQDAMAAIRPAGGSVRVIRSALPAPVTPMASRGAWALMQEIKSRFDPDQILNPSSAWGSQ